MTLSMTTRILPHLAVLSVLSCSWSLEAAEAQGEFSTTETEDQITIRTSALEAIVRKRGYVTGVFGGVFLAKMTGFRAAGFGLDIADWIMEPASDGAYRELLAGALA